MTTHVGATEPPLPALSFKITTPGEILVTRIICPVCGWEPEDGIDPIRLRVNDRLDLCCPPHWSGAWRLTWEGFIYAGPYRPYVPLPKFVTPIS